MARLLAFVAVAAAIAPASAQAKEELIGVLACGADRCAQLHGRGVDEASAILSRPFFHRSGWLPFYDVVLVWRGSDGRPTTYGALRWVPRAGATRTTGAGGPVWSHTGVALTAALSATTVGLRPRSARELDQPMEAVGRATAAARRALAPAPGATPQRDADRGPGPAVIAGLGVAALVVLTAAVALRRQRRCVVPR